MKILVGISYENIEVYGANIAFAEQNIGVSDENIWVSY